MYDKKIPVASGIFCGIALQIITSIYLSTFILSSNDL